MNDKLLPTIFRVWCQVCIVGEEHFSNENRSNLVLARSYIEQFAARRSADANSFAAVYEGVIKENR